MRPLPLPSRLLRFAVLAAAAFAAACAAPAEPRRTGLFTSLPILWRETGTIGDHLRSDAPPHWALAALREQGPVEPVDSFLAESRGRPLQGLGRLVMAQPRPLAPEENVALDTWVRGGGRVLLFADPMLTADSAFAIGDRRRPEDMVMLSPILARWGLRLEFDEDQPAGLRAVALLGAELPVDLPGRLALTGQGGCEVLADGLAARCRVGSGRVLVIADAALLEPGSPDDLDGRRSALLALLTGLGG